MPRDSGGTYSLPAVYQATAGTTIQPTQHNTPLEDIKDAITASLPRNGVAAMTGNLQMGSNRITGLAAGTTSTDAVNKAQLDAATGVDPGLTSFAALATTGVIIRTGSATYATRTITGTANQITVTNGDGVSGAPTLAINVGTGANKIPQFDSSGDLPIGAKKITGLANGTTSTDAVNKSQLDAVSVVASAAQPGDADLTALAALGSTGMIARTASNTYALRTITGTSNQITVTNGDGVSGNPTLAVNVGTTANKIVQLDASAKLPAVDGSQLTNLPSSMTRATAITTTSGTSAGFTGIPSTARRIVIMFHDVSTSGTSTWLVQVGTSGGYVTTGYNSYGALFGGSSVSGSSFTAGFGINNANASRLLGGHVELVNLTGNTWTAVGFLNETVGTNGFSVGGSIALGAALDRIRVTTTGGSDTFDSGSVNIIYE